MYKNLIYNNYYYSNNYNSTVPIYEFIMIDSRNIIFFLTVH